MNSRTRALWASTALVSGMLLAGAASAQSTGTDAAEATTVEEVVVTGQRGPRSISGAVVAQTVDKTRSTITQEYISRQQPGQSIVQTLNNVPGLNFTNNDPYGNSGGNIRLRGFDGNRVSLTFDGIPLNDTGNYAVFTNQQLDSELIERASVNQGTTDVDSPTASATGGTISYTTARPLAERSAQIVSSIGSFNYGRVFGRFDTGEFGPWGTTAYLAASYTDYDKWKGPGSLEKKQYNGRLFQDLGDGDFASLSFNWNENRNSSYNNFTNLPQFNLGLQPENDIACFRPAPVAGSVQNEANQATAITYFGGTLNNTSCTNDSRTRINPSNTGNIRGQFSYGLTDSLRLTIDPSFQYVMANGGGFTLTGERDDRLDQNGLNNATVTTAAQCTAAAILNTGTDLNGDGDSCDNVALYTPSNTNTRRYGVLSSLIWDVNDNHRVRVTYTNDYGRHRQTGEATRYNADGSVPEVFGGENTWGNESLRVFGRDGSYLRSRDRFSIALLNQVSAEYRGQFFDDALTVKLGVRAPFFTRELNQFCFSQNGSSTVRCTTEAVASTLANGNVTFASTGTTQFIRPYSKEIKYDAVLPNVEIGYAFLDNHRIYGSYAEGFSAPRTDNLYQPVRNASGGLDFSQVEPETTKSYDLGYRYTSSRLIASAAAWYTTYDNRIVSSFDNDPASPTFNLSIDRNLGEVKQQGFDASAEWLVLDSLSISGSASYNDSEVQTNVPLSLTTFLPTAGKKIVETPEWTYTLRAAWDITPNWSVGLQGKYVDERFTTDVNDEVAPSYTVVDFDSRYDLTDTFGIRNAFVQFNVSNLFDEEYPASISSGNNATTIDVDPTAAVVLRTGQLRTFSLGAPRTMVLTLGTTF
ncbi:TonB-dependent receptor [Brevundimonas sp.]|uniref:TonB-dependent receptor n=1 Tax=Brevundimonas sp. TaxID=1871086 RepID=UPI00260F5337|nr:TonB-dependent receptor [Brevundimonas sp.]